MTFANLPLSEKAYKRRLKDWNIKKNIRLPQASVEQAQAMVSAMRDSHSQQPSGPGQEELVRLPNGQTVRADRLVSHLRRKRKPTTTTTTTSTTNTSPFLTTDEQILARLLGGGGGNSNSPSAIRPPDALYDAEAVFVHVRAYIVGCVGDQKLAPEACDQLRLTGTPAAIGRWATFCFGMKKALEESPVDDDDVLCHLRRSPAELSAVVGTQHVNLVSHVLLYLQFLCAHASAASPEGRQLLRVVKSLARYMANYTASPQGLGLPRGHPLPAIFRGLSNLQESHLLRAIAQTRKLSCEVVSGNAVPTSTYRYLMEPFPCLVTILLSTL